MRRSTIAAVAVLAVLVPIAAMLPGLVPTAARAHGLAVREAGWCRRGLCVDGASAGRITARAAYLGWDGVLHLVDVNIADEHAAGGVLARAQPSADLSAARLPDLPFVRRVDVENLVVEGTPLPPLSGQVLPERHLVGQDARVDGDQAELMLHTEFGDVQLTVSPGVAGSRAVAARCRCTLEHPSLGGALVDRDLRIAGNLDGSTFTGEVMVEGVRVAVEAHLGGPARLTGRFALRPTPIAQVYAIFAPVVPELDRAELRGTISGTGRLTIEPLSVHFEPKIEAFAVDGLVGPEYRYGSFTWLGHDATGGPTPITGGDEVPGWISLQNVGELLPMAIISAEDASFLQHPGFDVQGMLAAADANAEAHEVVRGGSTLTQQLAKNLFLTGDRSYARKLRELLYAVEMERELGKSRILELYLNVVEWGPAIHGARAASEAYFLKEPRGLLTEEAAFLASILRNPRGGWARQYVGGRLNATRLGWIIDNMVGLHPVLRREALAREVRFVPPE
ncbi:MAG: hypothetical protein EXR71_12165 [Myxococcales bacterium]|nr:hypothetical protein [Myxococcales bacterium]